MRHKVSKEKLNRNITERKGLLKNLVNCLILEERITTTQMRAKTVKSVIDGLINKAKKGDLSSKRALGSFLGKKNSVSKLIEVIAPALTGRNSGYTRIINTGIRAGDNSKAAIIEFVVSPSEKIVSESKSKEGIAKAKKDNKK